MLAGLTSTSFAVWTGKGNPEVGIRDCLKDGSCQDWPNPDECVPIGNGHKYKW